MADTQNSKNTQNSHAENSQPPRSPTDDFFTATLPYHADYPAGKIQITPSKPLANKRDLSLAYTPGVGAVCKEIAAHPLHVWKYTNRGNTVAVISDGTAILGLGNIGPAAGLPVMEGKAVLFKKFADIDAYPICMKFDFIDKTLPPDQQYRARMEAFITAVRALEPTLGAINLEDVKAPECFELSERLDKLMDIAVFHDDQYGTAIVMCAGLINALRVVGKKFENVKIVMNGAGAAGIACAKLLVTFGAKKENIFVCDSKGLIVEGRTDLNEQKREFMQKSSGKSLTGDVSPTVPGDTIPQLSDVIEGADVFIGVSVAGALKPESVKKMNKDAIIFAMANPVPEIMPIEALAAGARIVATGRSDFANQVNNVLGYPGIFRGVLDTRASTVNLEMKMAAVQAIASLVDEQVSGFVKGLLENAYPEEVDLFGAAYGLSERYVLPKIFDLRVVPRVARMVAEAAMKTGVARVKIEDLDAYEKTVMERVEKGWR